MAQCLGVVARSRGMSRVAEETGLSREQLYKSFGEKGNPALRTFLALMNAMNARLCIICTNGRVSKRHTG
ncbi:MAG: putative addiction module antidote protein [Azoarcus sp.]|nr:putative addiction module antidote protein [Azoarcus sp.]